MNAVIIRSDVVDAIKEADFGISYRGFMNSKDERLLAIDPIDSELESVVSFITEHFPSLKTEVISCEPYRSLRRIIVRGFGVR